MTTPFLRIFSFIAFAVLPALISMAQTSTTPPWTGSAMLRTQNFTAYGSSDTKIPRFSNVITNFGTAWTFTTNATEGSKITILEDGVYSLSLSMQGLMGQRHEAGFSLNASAPDLTNSISNLASPKRIGNAVDTGSGSDWSITTYHTILNLSSNDVVRPHTDGTDPGSPFEGQRCHMTITKVYPVSSLIQPNATLWASGFASYGVSNLYVPRYLNTITNTGTSWIYTTNSTESTKVTILEKGVYAVSVTQGGNADVGRIGITLNASQSQLNQAIKDITASVRVGLTLGRPDTGTRSTPNFAACLVLSSNDVIHPLSAGDLPTSTNNFDFVITKISE
jgi:hypothetical protein